MSNGEDEVLQEEEEEQEEGEGVRPKHKPPVSQLAAPKIPEGDRVDFDDIHRKRMEKDLLELHTLIEVHFHQRRTEEAEIIALKDRIQRVRAEKERHRQARVAKKMVLSNMGAHFGGFLAKLEQGKWGKKQTGREVKKKTLGDRRRPLVTEDLQEDALRERAAEMWSQIHQLEADKFDLMETTKRQKYEVTSCHVIHLSSCHHMIINFLS
ncbi:hypothetical protein NHX12_025055 [Muraenolepis orangiensis]|uniref:Troponin T, slow skeletal muscle-like n=1 Tax=Muraenolepis orangiensis TaxID=630683 RepID=A0A9Q0IR95_9TELE|nr:hypothetical protein NHX12_025055 [Muraenolepis orangiensis]